MDHDARKRLAALLPEVAALLVQIIDTPSDTDGSPVRYYSAAEPGPLGSARAFLDAGRRGSFPTHKVGRRVVAKASDVHAWIERTGPRRVRREQPVDALDRVSRKAA